jgi:O-antigen ligase
MLPALVLLARGRLPPGPRSGAGQAGASAPGRLRRAYAGWAPVAAAAALAVMWAGLLISFSQSSFAALLVVVAGAAFIYWRWRALVVIAVAAAVLAGIAVAQPKVRQQLQHHTIHGLNEASSGRASLVAVGIRIAEANPAKGVGVGGFKRAYAKRTHLPGKEPKTAASHNTPVTVAAESGLPGILLYLWLVVAVFRQAFRRRTSLALIGGIGVAAILCHSLFYNAFFEDPVTWALFGLAAIGAPRQFARVREPVPDVERTQVPA